MTLNGFNTGDSPDDDEYEYEYDESDTETFYLNLDLSSYNGPIKPARRRSAPVSSSPSVNAESDQRDEPRTMGETDPNLAVDPGLVSQDRVQIMDLHTANPVVSYQNQIFTCSWVDQLGSEMVFSLPDQHPEIPTLRKDKDFELVSVSRAKLMGQKTNLISASGVEDQRQSPQEPQDPRLPPTNQGRFLQRLMDAKTARGEADAVRTGFPKTKLTYNLEESSQDAGRMDVPMAGYGQNMPEVNDDGARVLDAPDRDGTENP